MDGPKISAVIEPQPISSLGIKENLIENIFFFCVCVCSDWVLELGD